MKHSIKVNGIVITIELSVAVIDNETLEVVDEGYDSIKQANIFYPRRLFYFRWTAALLDNYGNIGYHVFASSKQRAISYLKKALL